MCTAHAYYSTPTHTKFQCQILVAYRHHLRYKNNIDSTFCYSKFMLMKTGSNVKNYCLEYRPLHTDTRQMTHTIIALITKKIMI